MVKLGVVALLLISSIFLIAMGLFSWAFISSGEPVGIGLGIGVLILMSLSAWMIYWELRFGMQSEKLNAAAEAAGITWDLKPAEIAAKQADYPTDSWQYLYLQAVDCESKRDRKGARKAVREALRAFN